MARHDQADERRSVDTARRGRPPGVPFAWIAVIGCGACGSGDDPSGIDAARTDAASDATVQDANLATDVTTTDKVAPLDGCTGSSCRPGPWQ